MSSYVLFTATAEFTDNIIEATAEFSDNTISATADWVTQLVFVTNEYDGDYTVTPSAETQTLATTGKYMSDVITINPIPSNYGLITWDGSTLTVS